MKMNITVAGNVLEKVMRTWQVCKQNTHALMQMQALMYHKCGMEMESRAFQEWLARKEYILRTSHAAWASLAIGVSFMAKDIVALAKRPRPSTLASFVVARKQIVNMRFKKQVLCVVVAWHIFTFCQKEAAMLWCQFMQIRFVRMRSCLNIWKASRNYRAALNAPLEMLRRSHNSRTFSTIIRDWQSTTVHYKNLCIAFRTVAHKTRKMSRAKFVVAWLHVSHSSRMMRLKIRRSAEMCVKHLWISLRIVWVHWIKVILAQRRLLHSRNRAWRFNLRSCKRKHFTSWRSCLRMNFVRKQP